MNAMQQILFATSNPHKIEEVQAILGELDIEVLSLDALDSIPPEPPEDKDTFEANAAAKAIGYATATGRTCLADDSGLQVDALSGAPGVYSARYAGDGDTREERDAANNRKLLSALDGIPAEQRTARFVCAMCLADPTGRILAETSGTFEGVIGESAHGINGFGYDPLLYLPDEKCTSAELSPQDKNARSHRGAATRAMVEKIRDLHRTA